MECGNPSTSRLATRHACGELEYEFLDSAFCSFLSCKGEEGGPQKPLSLLLLLRHWCTLLRAERECAASLPAFTERQTLVTQRLTVFPNVSLTCIPP